jgi:hypothetical protein
MENDTGRRLNPACTFRLSAAVLLFVSVILSGCLGRGGVLDPKSTTCCVFDDERLRLTADYCRNHYGVDSYQLTEPEMIVVHYTAMPTFGEI